MDEITRRNTSGMPRAYVKVMKSEPIPYRPLGLVANALEDCGLSVSYAYEDLIFVESTVALIKMCEKPEDIILYINSECPEQEAGSLEARLTTAARRQGLSLSTGGRFKLNQKAEKELDITFC